MKEITVRELGRVVTGHTPPTKKREYYGHAYPFVKPTDMNIGEKYTYVTEEGYSELGYEKYKTSLIPKGATCVVCIGTLGDKMTMAHCDLFTNQSVNSIIPNEHFDNHYVFYLLKHNLDKVKALNKGTASGREFVSKTTFLDMPIVIHEDIKTQQKIGEILSRYDDLIENNQKQIKLLEEAAQRIYKEWFVDLRFPGYENTPIIDDIPEGWRESKISDFVPTFSGGTPSRTHSEYYSIGTNLWVKTQELKDGFIFDTEEKITNDAINHSSAKRIPKGSILMAMYGATIGKLGIAAKELTCNQACCVFDISNCNYVTSYLFCWLKENRDFFITQGKGAAQPNLSQAMIKNFDIIIPPDNLLMAFSKITDKMLEKSARLQMQNIGLIEARDRLLPKLMSGEIEV